MVNCELCIFLEDCPCNKQYIGHCSLFEPIPRCYDTPIDIMTIVELPYKRMKAYFDKKRKQNKTDIPKEI